MDSYKEQVINRTRIINEKIAQIEKKLSDFSNRKNLSDVELKEERDLLIEKSNLEIERNSLYREFQRRENANQEKADEVNNKETSKSKSPWLTVGVWALVLAIAANTVVSCNNKKDKNVLSYDNTPSVSSTPTPGVTTTPTASVSPDVVTPEGMRSFTDPNNDEQVEQRAEDILNTYYGDWTNNLTSGNQKKLTQNIMANILRNSNSKLSISENGEVLYGEKVLDTNANNRIEVFGNFTHSPKSEELHSTYYSLLAPDGSEVAEFCKMYDDIYNGIAEAQNNDNTDLAIEYAKKLGYTWVHTWVYKGMYDLSNPFSLDSLELDGFYKDLMLGASFERWEMVKEFQDGRLIKGMCIPTCYEYGTNNQRLMSLDEIYAAIIDGKKNDLAMDIYPNEPTVTLDVDFYLQLKEVLEEEYNEYLSSTKALRLKK